MRNPNKYGTITKLKGNRRRPYIVKEGISGKQKPIGYTETREEALMLLARFNLEPWNTELRNITFSELYERWYIKKASALGKAAQSSIRSAYKHCSQLYDIKYKSIKAFHMQSCIDGCGYGYSTQGAIKNLFYHLDRFAMELDIINKAYSSLTHTEAARETAKKVFAKEEIKCLWDNADISWADSVLFFLYTGFRISEMVRLRTENVDLKNMTIQGGGKTQAGKNRIIPIHPRIMDIVVSRYNQSTEGYLFEYKGKRLSITQYRSFWRELMKRLGMTHTPHECRHTFRSLLDSAGANYVCIDRLMGHKSSTVGERIYTHKTIDELRAAVLMID